VHEPELDDDDDNDDDGNDDDGNDDDDDDDNYYSDPAEMCGADEPSDKDAMEDKGVEDDPAAYNSSNIGPLLFSSKMDRYITFSGLGPSEGSMVTFRNICKPRQSKLISDIRSVQCYLPDLRSFNGYSKGATSTTKAFGLTNLSALQEDGTVILKVKDLQEANKVHFEHSINALKVIKDGFKDVGSNCFLNRCEIKIKLATTSTDMSSRETYSTALDSGLQDLKQILEGVTTCASAITHVKLMELHCYALYGLAISMCEVSNDIKSTEGLQDFVAAYGELQAHGLSQWTGRNVLANKRLVAPKTQYRLKRPLFSPFNFQFSEKLKILATSTSLGNNLDLQELYLNFEGKLVDPNESRKFELDLSRHKQAIMAPLIAFYQDAYYRSPHKEEHRANVCQYCWSCFPPTNRGVTLSMEHPCLPGRERKGCLISMSQLPFRKYMESEVNSLDSDQLIITNWIINQRRSVFIFGPAGAGKSKVLQVLR
jgi:hypothetical protein